MNTKNISNFIRYMMKQADITPKVAAKCIGCSLGTFRNKLSLNRFSVEDLIILSELCDYHLAFVPINKNKENIYFSNYYIKETNKVAIEDYKKKKMEKSIEVIRNILLQKE